MTHEYLKAVIKNCTMDWQKPECESSTSVSSGNASNDEDAQAKAAAQNTMNLRSPGGSSRGRSVKEFEEQLANLKKENFNLKLRIYFLEERMGTNFDLDKENVVKKNIELMVEIESLKKELQEKHDLLCQAVKAMELEDDEHKKTTQEKEEQLMQCQQEIEDLRLQLQDMKYEADGTASSHKSFGSDPSTYYSKSVLPDTHVIIKELQDKVNLLEDELSQEKENCASLQLLLDQAEALKSRHDILLKEAEVKDERIALLTEELQQIQTKVCTLETECKDFEQKYEESSAQIESLNDNLLQKNKLIDEMLSQINDIRRKYTACRVDLEREHKRVERMKIMNDLKVTELEDETEKQKNKIRDLQGKLEAALLEVKKNQNLAVSKSPVHRLSASNTDVNSISASNTATSSRAAQKDALHVQIKSPVASIPSTTPPPSPNAIDIDYLQKIIEGGDENISMKHLVEQLQLLKNNYEFQTQKIIKLKAEQMKACKIIRGMIDSRSKYTQENTELKNKVEKLERELENVVSKPTPQGIKGQTSSQDQHGKVSEVDLSSGNPSPYERTMAEGQDASSELAEQYKALCVELEEKIKVLVATMNEKDSQMIALREKHEEILTNLQLREDRIVDLEFELLSSSQGKSYVKRSLFSEKGDLESEKDESFYMKQIDEKDAEIAKLTADISKLKSELTKRNGDLQGLVNKELWEKNRQIEKLENRHANALGDKDKLIVELKNDLSNSNLQVKVLEDKISELGVSINTSADPVDTISHSKSDSNSEDARILTEQLKTVLEERIYFEDKLKELQEKDNVAPNDEKLKIIETLKDELGCLQKEYEHSEKLRSETNDLCTILSSRLEELALFLDSLLTQKSVLGFLGSKENKKMREIINQSLDLSRTFTTSMLSNPEQSLVHLSNLSSVFNQIEHDGRPSVEPSKADTDTSLSIIPESVTLTYRSHIYASSTTNCDADGKSAKVIQVLREQIENLKFELQLRDTELCKLNDIIYQQRNEELDVLSDVKGKGDVTDLKSEDVAINNLNTSTTLKNRSENQSESEAWSEPDRSVSKARIGIDANSSNSRPSSGKRSRLTCKMSSESTEDELIYVTTRTPSKKSLIESRHTIIELHRQICEMEEKMVDKDTKLLSLEESSFKMKQILNEEQSNNEKLRSQVQNLERQVKEIEENLSMAEKKKTEKEIQIKNLQEVIECLTREKQELELHMEGERKEVCDRINLLDVEKNQALKTAKELEREVGNVNNQLLKAENKVLELQNTLDDMVSTLRAEYKEDLMKKMKYAEEQFVNQLKTTEEVANKEITGLREKMIEMEAQYKQDYVRKCEVEEKTSKFELMLQTNQAMKEMIVSFEEKINFLQAKETEYKKMFSDYHDKVGLLRKDLDNVTLQYSEAVLEKTKLANEKAVLEQELNDVNYKESEMKRQIGEIQSELANVKQNYQKQVTILQDQKLKLELRISELESLNSELHNRVISLRTAIPGDHMYSTSLPNATNTMYDIGNRNIPVNQLVNYRRQCSDTLNSGYTSEDQHIKEAKDGIYQFPQPAHPGVPVDLERHEANSSPDLGIESDHGRFSSLETQLNIPRPLLQTLELTESISNLLDAENNRMQNTACSNEHCCKKSVDMANENNDLKRKLMRTKRALEETVAQLSLANQRKKQVEKTICKQIHKTSQVLRKAKANLDSGSETDLYRK